jgi:hypothetical protein
MFVYETKNSLNLVFNGYVPVSTPDVEIRGYKNGAALLVKGSPVIDIESPEYFEGKAKTLAYQKDGKLYVTFQGIPGMQDPEVSLDESVKGTVEVVVNGTTATLKYNDADDSVTVVPVETPTPTNDAPVTPEVVTPSEPETIPEEENELENPEEVIEE